MTAQPPRSYKPIAIAIVVAALIVSGTIVYAVSFSGMTTTFTKTSTLTTTTTSIIQIPVSSASASNPSLGLVLDAQISVNATGGLTVYTNESNLLNTSNKVTARNDWAYPYTSSLPCGNWDQYPTDYAVFQGYYDTSNYTSAIALTLYNTGVVYSCPTMMAQIAYYLFAPLSDNASRFFASDASAGSLLVSADYSVAGYWTGSAASATFHPFPQGSYTVLVGDEWGSVVLLHFVVGSSGIASQSNTQHSTISVGGLSLCPSNCGYPAPYVSALVTFNANVPVSTLTVYVNNTFDGVAFQNPATTTIACSTAAGQTCSVQLGGTGYTSGTYTTITRYYATCSVPANSTTCSATYTGSLNTLTVFADEYKGSVPSNFVPIVPGDTYVFTFVAVFQDGSAATATVSVVATSTTASVTGTSVNSASDTYLTSCSVTGIGGFELRVASDSTGASVSGETINAVDRLGCNIVGQSPESQVVYLDNFSEGQGGWLTPVFPNQAEPGGELDFTIIYQGQTYQFSSEVPPIGTACVTLHVPSGNVTTTTVMNGNGSYCT